MSSKSDPKNENDVLKESAVPGGEADIPADAADTDGSAPAWYDPSRIFAELDEEDGELPF